MRNLATFTALTALLTFLGLTEAKFQFIWQAKRYKQLPPYIGKENYDLSSQAILVERFHADESADNGHHFNMTLKEWFAWKEDDGFLCRTHRDCDWLDVKLYCQNYKVKLEMNPWFGMDVGQKVDGYCACPIDYIWDDGTVECREPTFWESALVFLVLMLIFTVICIICGCSQFVCEGCVQTVAGFCFHVICGPCRD